jgi:hypothetical protein
VEQQLHGLGDAAAVAFTKQVGARKLSWTDIEHFLALAHEAFAVPQSIEKPSDRQPKTTLFVLQMMERMPVADELKRAIVDTRVFLERQTSFPAERTSE